MKTLWIILTFRVCAHAFLVPSTSSNRLDGHANLPSRRSLPQSLPSNLSIPLIREVSQYYLNFHVGYPPQNMTVSLDTGSSDTWVRDPIVCPNCSWTYNISASHTGKLIHTNVKFQEDYSPPKLTNVSGYYASDVFNIAGVDVFDVNFGVVNSTTSTLESDNPGIMGIGLDAFQAFAFAPQSGGNTLPSLAEQMKTQNIINSTSFGVYLGGQYFYDPSPGQLTFGGYDSSKFSGTLLPLPMAPSPDQWPRLQVWLASATVTANGKTQHLPSEYPNTLGTSVTLDTGSPGSVLPRSMYNKLVELLGADPNTRQVSCKYVFKEKEGLTFSFMGFGGKHAHIWVPFRYMIQWGAPQTPDCKLSFTPEEDCSRGGLQVTCSWFGSDFLRAAYIYIDYDSLTVSMAQARYETPFTWGFDQAVERSQKPLINH